MHRPAGVPGGGHLEARPAGPQSPHGAHRSLPADTPSPPRARLLRADGTELAGSRVVLAAGHSARDVYAALADAGVAMSPKNFALGFRVEHPQALIDQLQYGADDAAGEAAPGRALLRLALVG